MSSVRYLAILVLIIVGSERGRAHPASSEPPQEARGMLKEANDALSYYMHQIFKSYATGLTNRIISNLQLSSFCIHETCYYSHCEGAGCIKKYCSYNLITGEKQCSYHKSAVTTAYEHEQNNKELTAEDSDHGFEQQSVPIVADPTSNSNTLVNLFNILGNSSAEHKKKNMHLINVDLDNDFEQASVPMDGEPTSNSNTLVNLFKILGNNSPDKVEEENNNDTGDYFVTQVRRARRIK